MSGEQAPAANAATKNKATRQRSTIGFPYMDLDSAVGLANAIYSHVALGECDDDQLATWSNQSAKASTFRVQVYTARTFGILEGDGGKHKLAELGYDVHDFEGRIDFDLRDAIRDMQVKYAMLPDGHPTAALLDRLGVKVP